MFIGWNERGALGGRLAERESPSATKNSVPKSYAQKSTNRKRSVYRSKAVYLLLSKRPVAKCPILDHGRG